GTTLAMRVVAIVRRSRATFRIMLLNVGLTLTGQIHLVGHSPEASQTHFLLALRRRSSMKVAWICPSILPIGIGLVLAGSFFTFSWSRSFVSMRPAGWSGNT